ncbi:MAG TPA: hypothetical protein VJU16_08815, partial [Planctomycetota bacterium]|nr:hypothetical protein [Planctomycetota bacterium]
RGNPERLVGVYGYEIADKSYYRPGNIDAAEIPLLLGLSLPPKPLKSGQSHEWTLELDESFDCGAVTAKCTAARGPAVEIDLVSCAKIDLTARLSRSLRPPATPKPMRNIEKGRLEATLYFDPVRGVARRLDFHVTLTMAPADPKGAIETIETRERLVLEEILAIRHKTFEAEVNAAIDKGIAYLWRNYNAKENRWGAHYEHATGPTALALLTILKGSMDRKDERILKALDWLMGQPLMHTYDVAVSLMALEAFYSPVDANRKTPAAAADKDIEAKMDAGHARWGSSAARWLEQNLAKAMWSYPSTDANARDFSNTQYGVLGLYSAARCGFSPDLGVVKRVQETYLRAQQKKGPRVELSIGEGEQAGKTMARSVAEARGWTYYDNLDDPPYGSMTAGGISSLVILDALRRRANDAKYDVREQVRVRTAIRDGWAWLLSRWTVKSNPLHGRDWLYYYLYGLERCAMLDGVTRLGEHDWYGEGATYLVANQTSSGYWHTGKYVNIYDNCFAILFLKRATVRVATGK